MRRIVALLFVIVLLFGVVPTGTAAPSQSSGRRPVAVMIDNHPAAYPQIGLDKASIVFEALAEYGITRFMAIYIPGVSPEAATIGPVRSARLYYVQWAMGFRALYAHAGGSPQALDTLNKTQYVVNLDALKKNGGAYFSRSSKRKAPHNLFTSSAALDKAAAAFNAAELSDQDVGYLYKDEAPGSGGEAATQIGYYFLYKQESAGWVYDTESNSYLRLRRGKAHNDGATGEQLRFKNVVVMEVKERKIAGDAKGRIEQDVVGSGPAKLFVDGVQVDITWSKDGASAPLRFLASDGSEVRFNNGNIWIAVVPKLANLSVK